MWVALGGKSGPGRQLAKKGVSQSQHNKERNSANSKDEPRNKFSPEVPGEDSDWLTWL